MLHGWDFDWNPPRALGGYGILRFCAFLRLNLPAVCYTFLAQLRLVWSMDRPYFGRGNDTRRVPENQLRDSYAQCGGDSRKLPRLDRQTDLSPGTLRNPHCG